MTTVSFEGCESWPIDNEVIELVVGLERYDLHNDADLLEFSTNSVGETATVRMAFRARPLTIGHEANCQLLVVEFARVKDLNLEVHVAVPHEAGLFLSFEYLGGRALGLATDCLDAHFEAERVLVRLEPLAP